MITSPPLRAGLLVAVLVPWTAAQQPTPLRAADPASAAPTTGWLDWRGPDQCGRSHETGLPDALAASDALWTFDMRGRGTPVVHEGHLYAMAYKGEGPDLIEGLVCLDAKSGDLVWQALWSDFLTDVVYDRYAIGSPTVDPETGDVVALSTAGVLKCFTRDGGQRWEVSLMEDLGRLTFPNGRTGSVNIAGDRILLHVINAHWGKVEGPARDRFYAFDKRTGEVLWSCTPGVTPKDSSFSHPPIEERGGHEVLYAGTGCGYMVAIDARTGDPLWRYQMSIGGVNSSPVIHGDDLIAIHGKENPDSSVIGRLVSLPLGTLPADAPGPVELPLDAAHWREDYVAFTSSPVLVGDRVYLTDATGELCAIDAGTGALIAKEKLGPDQIHASPAWADGKLYVPLTNGHLFVYRTTDEGLERLSDTLLEGSCLGAPAICGGRIYVHTTERLYCFGEVKPEPAWPVRPEGRGQGEIARLRVVPQDVLLTVGDPVQFRVQGLDVTGRVVSDVQPAGFDIKMAPTLNLVETSGAAARPGLSLVTFGIDGGKSATARVRVVRALPWTEDFEGFELSEKTSDGVAAAAPPSYWLGVNKKWDVVEKDGGKVLRQSLDNPLFQRTMGFCGDPDMSDYTATIDVMTEGNRRSMSAAGLVNQRYLVQLIGNYRALQISSNDERIKVQAPFAMQPGVWYRLKSRVDIAEDGSGVVRAKAWPRDETEPQAWTLEVPHAHAHTHGSPGIYGFVPQSRFHVYVDNFTVTPNE